MPRKLLLTRPLAGRRAYFERAVLGASRVLAHELDALSGHWVEVLERVAVAREARGLRDLLRAQADLVPETRARLALDHRERRALLHSLVVDLRGRRAAA